VGEHAETLVPVICVVEEATATAGGMPKKMRIGVVRKPPPTPTIPLSSPTTPPSAMMASAFTERPATGR
jgi:hypothetical protein